MTSRPETDIDALVGHVRAHEADYLRDLSHLVGIDSGTYTKSGVDDVSRWMGAQLERIGARLTSHPHEELGQTLVAEFAGRADGPSVLLIGHADTVFEAGTVAQRGFAIDGGRATGPGVSDMKGGLLAGLYALTALREAAGQERVWLPLGRLVFIVNPDEEIGSPSSTAIISQHAAGADVALVLEGGRPDGAVVSARAGMLHLRIAVAGRAAHAGVAPEEGRSAIAEAAHKIVALTALTDRAQGLTVNVGQVRGGTRPNVVPAEAELMVDVRATTRAAMESAEAAIADIVAAATVAETTSGLQIQARYLPMETTPASARLADMAEDIAARLGVRLGQASSNGASDANTTAGAGVPTLDGLGPVGGAWHSTSEYLELDSIVPRTTLLAALIAAIGNDHWREGPDGA